MKKPQRLEQYLQQDHPENLQPGEEFYDELGGRWVRCDHTYHLGDQHWVISASAGDSRFTIFVKEADTVTVYRRPNEVD
jgi:hypothetical protein